MSRTFAWRDKHPSTSAHRLELLEYIAQGQQSVEDLAALSKLTFANTSRHLQILRRARLVETERRGKHILYSLVSEGSVVTFLKALGYVGERNHVDLFAGMDAGYSLRTLRDRLHSTEQTHPELRPPAM